MKIMETIGIDVSKVTLEVYIHSSQELTAFENLVKGCANCSNEATDPAPTQRNIFLWPSNTRGFICNGYRIIFPKGTFPMP